MSDRSPRAQDMTAQDMTAQDMTAQDMTAQDMTAQDMTAEGGHGAVPVTGVPATPPDHSAARRSWPLWEVFVRPRRGLSHGHVGSLHAPDAAMALRNARDLYTRRSEGVSIWVVPAESITASSPDERDEFFDPAADKVYRHPTFYEIPDEVQHL